jgi:hypothetical protein
MELPGYKKILELDQIKYGAYVRWFSNNTLKRGMFVCDIIITDDGIIIKGKTYKGAFINIKLNECILYQKMSSDEIIINHFLK